MVVPVVSSFGKTSFENDSVNSFEIDSSRKRRDRSFAPSPQPSCHLQVASGIRKKNFYTQKVNDSKDVLKNFSNTFVKFPNAGQVFIDNRIFNKLNRCSLFKAVYVVNKKHQQAVLKVNKIYQRIVKEKEADILKQFKQGEQRQRQYPIVQLIDFTTLEGRWNLLLLEKLEKNLNECYFHLSSISKVVRLILQALFFVHQKQIVHMDIKMENIMVSQKGVVKIIDFDWAVKLDIVQNFCKKRKGKVGTIMYNPPEVIYQKWDQIGMSFDLWSVGCVFFSIYTHHFLFNVRTQGELKEVFDNLFPENSSLQEHDQNLEAYIRKKAPKIPNLLLDLIVKLLRKDPKKRLTISQALSHSFLQKIEKR